MKFGRNILSNDVHAGEKRTNINLSYAFVTLPGVSFLFAFSVRRSTQLERAIRILTKNTL